jgi:hypothetical protein
MFFRQPQIDLAGLFAQTQPFKGPGEVMQQ